MRIFLALAASPNPGVQLSNIWKTNLYEPLVHMGHDVVLWDGGIQPLFDMPPRAPETAPARAAFTEAFMRAVAEADRAVPLDLVLTYLSDSHLEPAAIDGVRERVAPIVNFYCNNVHQFHLVERISPHFDLCLVPERIAFADYARVGARVHHFPMAANPRLYRPMDVPVRYDVTFTGMRYADRSSALLALRERGVDAHAFGPGWQGVAAAGHPDAARRSALPAPLAEALKLVRFTLEGRDPVRVVRDRLEWNRLRARHGAALHGPVDDEAYVRLYSESRISVGFVVVGDTHRTKKPGYQVRLREFEAPMSGAFYLTGYFEELDEFYDIGREIAVYRSHEELVDRCRWYLAHEAEREAIRRAGLARAQRDHTWERRFAGFFVALEKLTPAASRRAVTA
jgi:hypothetical protein